MRTSLIVGTLICAIATVGLAVEHPTPKPAFAGPAADLSSEQAIRALYAQFVAAWNRHDAKALAAMWAPDGDHMEPDGRRASGRAEVEKHFIGEHSKAMKTSTLTLDIKGVWFITADVALVDGSYKLTGVRGAEGKEIPAREGHLTSVLMHERGRWWVAASRAMIPIPLVWREH